MSCHISALCIALPCPKRGLVETTFGERNSCRVEKTPISPLQSTDNTSASPSIPVMVGGGGHLLRREHLPLHSPVSHEEGGVQHLSLLRFMLERHTTRRRRVLRSGDLFSGQSGHTGTVSSVEDRIRDQKTVLCCISGLLYSPS